MDMLPHIPHRFVGAWSRSYKPGAQSIHWDPLNPSLRHQSTQAVGPDSVRTAKIPSTPKLHLTMDVLPSIPYVLWVHGKGLTRLKTQSTHRGAVYPGPLTTHAMGLDVARTAKQPCHLQVGVCCYM